MLGNIEQLVRGAAEDAPDVYNNDMYGLTRAMVAGYLWNVKNPGTDASGNANAFGSSYASNQGSWQNSLTTILDKLAKLE